MFHSIPLTDIVISASLALTYDDTNANYAFVGYVGRMPQTYTTVQTAAGINLNFLAKQDFMLGSYDVTFPGAMTPTTICLRSSTGPTPTCNNFQVLAGDLKNAIGLWNWTYAPTAQFWRIQYRMSLVGLSGATVYFNGNTANVPGSFTGQITSITWTSTNAPFGFTFTYNVQQMFNKGDNTFATATTSASGTVADLRLNVDIPLNSLAVPSGLLGWWLYDPSVAVTTTDATGTGTSPASSSLMNAWTMAVCIMVALLTGTVLRA
jgi:hypothetical protein